MRHLPALAAAAALALVPVAALADIAPPPGYVEDCTVDKKEQAGTTCESCAGSYEDYDGDDSAEGGACEQHYAGTDFAYVCQSSGASFWTEVWCDGPPRETACSLAPGGAVAPAVVALLGGLLLVLGVRALRRRS